MKWVKVREWLGRWWKSIVVVVAAFAAFGGAFWGSLATETKFQVLGFVIGGVGTLAAALVPIWETRQLHTQISDLQNDVATAQQEKREGIEEARREGREDFLLIVDFVLKPLLDKLGPLVRSTPRSTARTTIAAEIRTSALWAIKEVIDPSIPMLRANYFKLKYTQTGQAYLRAAGSTSTPPRPRFDLEDGSEQGAAILEMLALGDYVFTANCKEDPPKGFDAERERSYQTFISATASAGEEVEGMLTVDSPVAGSLTEADAVLVRLVATIVALSETVEAGRRD